MPHHRIYKEPYPFRFVDINDPNKEKSEWWTERKEITKSGSSKKYWNE